MKLNILFLTISIRRRLDSEVDESFERARDIAHKIEHTKTKYIW